MNEKRLWRQAQADYLHGNIGHVLQMADAALVEDARSFVAWSIKGFALSEMNLPGELECYERMIELRPDFSEGYYSKANFFHGENNLRVALPLYRKAVRLLRRDRDSHFSQELFHAYAECLSESGDLAGALSTLKKGMEHPAVVSTDLLRELYKRVSKTTKLRHRPRKGA